jgi:hypothetical protein
MCHQLLAARRPAPDRLTEFYLLMSLGGVVGGAFTALLAPVIFNMVWEYPLVLVLVGLARPNSKGPIRKCDADRLCGGGADLPGPAGALGVFGRQQPGLGLEPLRQCLPDRTDGP